MGHGPVGAPGSPWNDFPGHGANTEEKRFTGVACGQVISSPSLHLLHSSPLNPSLKLPPSLLVTPPPSAASSIS
ncbi:hypothetical protein KUCAC02_002891, partial [Chaenocephalus aceratus]